MLRIPDTHIFVSSRANARNAAAIRAGKITHVVNAAAALDNDGNVKVAPFSSRLEVHDVPVLDMEQQDLVGHWRCACVVLCGG